MPGTRTPVIALEDIGLPGRVTREMYAPRRVRKSISVADVYPQDPVPETPTRSVSGDWLASVLALEPELAAELVGREVTVEEEAWFAVQAQLNSRLRWSAQVRKITRRRAAHWPVQPAPVGAAQLVNPTASGPCECWGFDTGSVRFVDSELGDDMNPGGFVSYTVGSEVRLSVRPWRTLCQVETWLNDLATSGACVMGTGVFLRRGQVWTGGEEPGQRTNSCPCEAPTGAARSWEERLHFNSTTNTSAALTVMGFKGTKERPLVISAYGDEGGNGSDRRPVIDGCTQRVTGARYGREEVGLLFYDCCYVLVTNISVRGFKTAIQVRRGSKHHVYENVFVHGNARAGFEIGTTEADLGLSTSSKTAEVAAAISAATSAGLYPANIGVLECQAESNGYDTKGADIELGFLATNCTISGNVLMGGSVSAYTGAAVRGIDGVVSQGGSSGHLIEKNRIGEHRAWCTRARGTTGADQAQVVKTGGCGSGGEPVIQHPCSSARTASCVDLRDEYGYWASYNSGTPTGDDTVIGEDGIDLKGVRQRTPDAQKETIVCDNVIWGHTSFGFSGVTVNDGSQDIYVFRNRIFQNSVGIHVTNSRSKGFYVEAEDDVHRITRNVYIYRNLVYMNEQRGIHVESTFTTLSTPRGFPVSWRNHVENVWIVNNTIAHNLWTGVHVQSDTGVGDVSGVFMYNNLIARNGIAGPDADRQRQVTWSAEVALMDPAEARSDFNCYLGWGTTAAAPEIRWGASDKSQSGAKTDWGIENSGQQVANLSAIDLVSSADLTTSEGSRGAYLAYYIDASLASVVELLDYDVGSTASDLYRAGKMLVGVDQPDAADDIVQSVDINGDRAFVTSPSVGAFEGPK